MNKILIRTSFKNNTHALIFLCTLFFTLISPILISFFERNNNEDLIEAGPEIGSLHQIHNFYNNDIEYDIVFLGSSLLWTSVSPPIIAEHLNKNLDNKINVVTLASNWRGEDMLYRLWSGFLENKEAPKLLILSMPKVDDVQLKPHPRAHVWWSFKDFKYFFHKMNLETKLTYYATSVLGAPRKILSIIRNNSHLKRIKYSLNVNNNKFELTTKKPWIQPDSFTGELSVSQGFLGNSFEDLKNPPPPLIDFNDIVFSAKTLSKYKIHNTPLTLIQKIFLEEIFDLAQKNNVKVIVLNIPIYKYLKNTEKRQSV